GKQSAALLVVSGKPTGKVWIDRKIDLRVDDSTNPLKELRRLLDVKTAYDFMNAGDVAVEAGNYAEATKAYSSAEKMFPDNLEMQYWHAVNLANQGDMKKALPMFRKIFEQNNDWKMLTPRLIKPGILNVTDKQLKEILNQ
ncbi:MAG: tetratricopeptide repeat protein, partial [Cyclobacteriaceae bacterium]